MGMINREEYEAQYDAQALKSLEEVKVAVSAFQALKLERDKFHRTSKRWKRLNEDLSIAHSLLLVPGKFIAAMPNEEAVEILKLLESCRV